MDELLFVDSTFKKDNTSKYELSIQICLDGFSFFILNSDQKCLALSQSKSLNSDSENISIDALKESIRNCEFLNLNYNQVSIIWLTKKASLIPSELFSEALAANSFQLCHPLSKDESLSWDELEALNAYLVYALPSTLPDFIETQFPGAKILHQSFNFYQKALKQTLNTKHPKVYVQIYNHFFDAIIPDKDQKHFVNSYTYKDETDIVYFILNIYKQLKLNTEYSQLLLSGKINESGKNVELLKKHIKEIEIENTPSELLVKNSVSNSEYNQFTKLLNTNRCE